jgi:hypothetical protein
MGRFGIIWVYLTTFEVTFLAYAKARLLFVGGKNTDLGNSGILMFTLINIFGDKVAC